MTESEWLACNDPTAMAVFLADRESDRKRRLYACACCRLVCDLLVDKSSLLAVRKLEAYADDLRDDRPREEAFNIANAARKRVGSLGWTGFASAANVVFCAAHADVPEHLSLNLSRTLQLSRGLDQAGVRRLQAEVIRDLIGNPFRPVTLEPAWLTSAAVGVAAAIYDARAFHDLPILADALQDAGCDDADVLDHLRGPGPHARGCWVVDLVLGRA